VIAFEEFEGEICFSRGKMAEESADDGVIGPRFLAWRR
jgi:hypothetical protein